jgi:peptidoglycan/LPS O-acetylase OafA/YrhL
LTHTSNKIYLEKIDAIRGIAILLVLTYHTFLVIFPKFEVRSYSENGIILTTGIKSILLNFNPMAQGWIGVNLFLVISGFLIHFIYLQNKAQFGWKSFFSKRFWRIYPPYFLILSFFFLIKFDFTADELKNFLFHATLIHNLDQTTFFGINPSFWSIALEAQLYLIYPAFIFLVNKFSHNTTIKILISINLFFIVTHCIFNFDSLIFHTNVINFWIVWGAGAFLAERYFSKKRLFSNPLKWLIISYISFYFFKIFLISNNFIILPITISCMALIEFLLYSKNLDSHSISRLIIRILSFIGIISYSIYLIHQPYLGKLIRWFNPNTEVGSLNIMIALIITYSIIFITSYFLYQFVEKTSVEFGKKRRLNLN